MKRISTILTAILITATAWAQSSEKMSYQSVVRNASDQLVTNQDMGMQISILQGSASGTAVYVETHSPTTNANGLLSIEIGNGTVVSGDFTAIDWASDIYFLKTETDPTTSSGTNYTITGTSQLLSVPYALHAKTAESITGGIIETDPVFSGSQANNITATDITNLSNLSGTNTGDQSISRTDLTVTLSNGGGTYQDSINTYTAGDGIDITGTTVSEHKYQIGDFAQGGIIFWIDETGEHGLVCAKEDQSSAIRWYAGSNTYTMSIGNGPLAGSLNTAIIIAKQGYGDGATYAARICNELQITEGGKTYGDWYLPSRQELNLMHQNRTTINTTATANGGASFGTGNYWSSTEYLSNTAWIQIFPDGAQGPNPKDFTHRLRAIRAF